MGYIIEYDGKSDKRLCKKDGIHLAKQMSMEYGCSTLIEMKDYEYDGRSHPIQKWEETFENGRMRNHSHLNYLYSELQDEYVPLKVWKKEMDAMRSVRSNCT